MTFDNSQPAIENGLVHPLLASTTHRPWPLPAGPWLMSQTWNDLLFAHWPVDPAILRPLVPPELPLDQFEGQCWVAVAPFHMSDIHFRGLPALPGLSRFPELNVRAYVTVDGKPGVYFFSLDAANLPAVWAARVFYRLPYFHARMSAQVHNSSVVYESTRFQGHAEFRALYRPIAPVMLRERGSLANWLTERYCLYTVAKGMVYRAEIHHQQWPLQDAAAKIEVNTMAAASGISLPSAPPLLHFSRKLEVLIWPLRRFARE
jgi:hypothetical protein